MEGVVGLPFEIREDDDLGRHLVAARDLPRGEVLIRETPIGEKATV